MSTTLTENKEVKTTNNPYAALQDITEVRPYDAEKDKALFNDLRKVLEAHGAKDRFGVTLLHDHFEVNDGEQMIETHDPITRELTIKPYRTGSMKHELQATNWKFDGGEVVALQFCVPTGQGHIGTIQD
ncbi:hypothetical protein [uncultured Microscilla sp.]|uniref:hypothetical protein n=1 Tax=uncultured Microscilla sp. TaxID=432653 RepID=UPI002602CDC7|nr:hypothetical protein [uncultured Microscilla sp.]